jgi:hypothetical protein
LRYGLSVAGVQWFWGIDGAVYVDGDYVGRTNCEFFVGPGTHLVAVGVDSEFIFFFGEFWFQNWLYVYVDESNSPDRYCPLLLG